jgi:transcriptional regulator with XRE-family HTH domain
MELKDRIKLARIFANLTQTELATACGWEWGSRVGNYEQGKTQPSLADLRTIAQACGVDEAWLTTGIGNAPGMAAAASCPRLTTT